MSRAGDFARDALQTGFRLFPWPTEPGLRKVGNPHDLSPVVITANYDLTVRRVLRALHGEDVWVVVAPASGINVWCAASGGHFGTSQVVTALKTSGIAECVRHRRAVLPQLSATGVIAREVSRRSGWRVKFGPVYATDLPRYLASGEKTDDMRRVGFPLRERLEMAATWAVPAALALGVPTAFLRPAWAAPLLALIAALSVAVFTGYDKLPEPRKVILGGAASLLSGAAVALAGGGPAAGVAAVVACVALTALLTFDYSGSTPVEGGSHFAERAWQVRLDEEKCRGVYACWAVCPEACFEKLEEERKVSQRYDDRCIRCGACIVQCPMDALAFEDGAGRRVEPDTIRRTKLNLMGQRSVDV